MNKLPYEAPTFSILIAFQNDFFIASEEPGDATGNDPYPDVTNKS